MTLKEPTGILEMEKSLSDKKHNVCSKLGLSQRIHEVSTEEFI